MSRSIVGGGGGGGGVGGGERGSSMEEVHQKLAQLQYPRSSAPSQSLLYAGLERYALLEWLFFRFDPSLSLSLFVFFFFFLNFLFGCVFCIFLGVFSTNSMVAKRRVAILWGFCVHYKPLNSYVIADFKLFCMTPMSSIVSMATNIGLQFCGAFMCITKF